MRFAAALLFGTIAQPSVAVHLALAGRGQVLFYPYYSVQGSYDTLFSMTAADPASFGKAVKVRLREGRNSRIVLDINVYLRNLDAWTAAITRDAAGNPILRTLDGSCTVPQMAASPTVPGAREIALSNVNYAGLDGAGSGLDRAKEGYIEVIEMGNVRDSYSLPNGILLRNALSDCASLNEAWAPGGIFTRSGGAEMVPPSGGLFGSASLIDVPTGIDFSTEPTALAGVFSIARHTPPGSLKPNLDDAVPVSLVVAEQITISGDRETAALRSTWNHGSDAVSAVLMHAYVHNEYSVNTAISASTDLVYTFPTKVFHVARDSTESRFPFDATPLSLDPDTGKPVPDSPISGTCNGVIAWMFPRENGDNISIDTAFPTPPNTFLCWSTSVISMGKVLRSANSQAPLVPFQDGSFGIELGKYFNRLSSKEGHSYIGLPVIGFAAQKYVNGNVQSVQSSGSVLSNYGSVLGHRYIDQVRW